MIALGDSNQVHASDGWDHGWTRALSESFALYSTQLLSPGENLGNAAGLGYTFQTLTPFPSTQFQVANAPAPLDLFMASSGLMEPHNYLYLPPNLTAANAANQGILIDRASPLNVNAALRFRVVTARFENTDAPGTFQLAAKLAEPPWSTIATATLTPTSAPQPTLAVNTLDLPAATRHSALNFRFAPDDAPLNGPFLAYFMRVENVDRPVGVAFHTLYYKGLQSARDMAAALQAASDQYLTLYCSEARALQTAPVKVLIRINAGVNDRSEPLPSVGPRAVTPGSSPDAFADNLEAIMLRFRAIWTLNNWDQNELAFLIAVTHPIQQPDDPQLVAFRLAADDLARRLPSVAVTHFDRITSATEMLQNNWYPWSGFDRNHLRMPGYETLSRREIEAIRTTPCPADADHNAEINTADLVLLLADFGKQVPPWTAADTNGTGTIDTADLVNLLATFGNQCP